MKAREIFQVINRTLNDFYRVSVHYPNKLIISRNYIDVLKREGEEWGLIFNDEDLSYKNIPIVIDECRSNIIEVGFLHKISENSEK